MKDFAIKMLLNNLLMFLASTVKNPKSVAKYVSIFTIAYEAIGSILASFGQLPEVPAQTSRLGSSESADLQSRLTSAASELFSA